MATDILTSVENYGKAQSAFAKALTDAATARQQAMTDLGASIIGQSGKVITPMQAAKMLGPSGTGLPKTAKITTGFGEGALASIAKEEAGAAYAATRDIQTRGVGVGGLAGQARTIAADTGDVAKQQAIQDTMKTLAGVESGVLAARSDLAQARAVANTARGITPKKKGGK
jgi:hypothetical protein